MTTSAHRAMVKVNSGMTATEPGLQKAQWLHPCLGLFPVASASGPGREARLGHHLVVVKVPVDREPMSPDPLGLTGGAAPGPPLDHTGCIALGPHELWGLLVLLHGLCGEKWMRGSGWGEGGGDRTAPVVVPSVERGSLLHWATADGDVTTVPVTEAGVQPG